MSPARRHGVVVLGSINVDSTSYVERFPAPGETISSTGFAVALGGKGANQAVAALRAGASVDLVGLVGADATGAFARDRLDALGLPTDGVGTASGHATGVAQITVDARGENTVIVSAGANAAIDGAVVDEREAGIRTAAIAVTQGEVPVAAIEHLARRTEADGTRMLLNLAPPVDVPDAVLAVCDPLVVNELEAAAIGLNPDSVDPTDHDAWREIARSAVGSRARSVVITLGARGAVAADATGDWAVAAPEVEAVDSTGAGDCFVGTLAAVLADGAPLSRAVRLAVAAASLSVRGRGTVDSYADRASVLAWAEEEGLA